ncbi:MAG: hypothetical protein ACI9TY_000055 [Alphaproteobacteria bacterium]|jgi:hypothetical protein
MSDQPEQRTTNIFSLSALLFFISIIASLIFFGSFELTIFSAVTVFLVWGVLISLFAYNRIDKGVYCCLAFAFVALVAFVSPMESTSAVSLQKSIGQVPKVAVSAVICRDDICQASLDEVRQNNEKQRHYDREMFGVRLKALDASFYLPTN